MVKDAVASEGPPNVLGNVNYVSRMYGHMISVYEIDFSTNGLRYRTFLELIIESAIFRARVYILHSSVDNYKHFFYPFDILSIYSKI